MILSMTGFGKGVATTPSLKITVEIKSLNSKQLDMSLRLPGTFREADLNVRSLIGQELQRGKVDAIVLTEDIASAAPACINIEALSSYKAQIEEMARQLGIEQPADWYATLLRLPDALKQQTPDPDDSQIVALMTATAEAAKALTDFRTREGAKLEAFFRTKLDAIAALLTEVEPFEQDRVKKIRERLEENLSRLEGVDVDRGRLEQELIFYIEKLDVTEEKIRLRSHLSYFAETLSLPTPGQGKKLGFIAQEMGREINTLGSKSNNADMQRIVVRMKDELEQIKEQVLNVL
ncbi:MAG: YicC family protein [Bacteroidales bacterium]|nr:YicC family protein [Bacteroidales bacterium]